MALAEHNGESPASDWRVVVDPHGLSSSFDRNRSKQIHRAHVKYHMREWPSERGKEI
jgi:hypothetical protein